MLAVLLPAVGIALAGSVLLWQQAQRETERQLLSRARALAASVQRELAIAETMLTALATAPALAAGDLEVFHRQVRSIALPAGGRIVLTDVSGQMWLNSMFEFGRMLPKRGDLAIVEQVFATGQRQVSDVYMAPLTREPLVAIDVPVFVDGRVAFDLNVGLRAAGFSRLLVDQMPSGPGWVMGIFDRKAAFVSRLPEPERFSGQPGTAVARDVVTRSAPEGIYRSPGADGLATLGAYTRVPGIGWTVFVARHEAVLNGALVESLARVGLAALAVLGLGLAAALYQARRIARSLQALERDAHRLGAGEAVAADSSVAHGVREAGAVRAALVDASERLAQRAAERDAAEHHLKLANQRKDEFLAMLAHELRNPLAPLTNALQFVERTENLAERGRSALAMAKRQTCQLQRLVDDLLEVARITRGRIELKRERMTVGAAVQNAVEAVGAECTARGLLLAADVPSKPLWIDADPVRIAQVLGNLLSNACKYTPAGGRIAVSATEHDDAVEIHVADNGLGVKPDELPQLFELFHQIDATLDRSAGGLGIGLALVRMLVELHEGTVRAESPGLGQGATFTVRLPRAPAGSPSIS